MCRGTLQQQGKPEQLGQGQQNHQQRRNSTRTPTSALEHCLQSRGVEQAWDLLEVLLQSDHASTAEGHHGLVSADKYTVSQMLSKTTSALRNKDDTNRGINLAQSFINSFPSDVDEGLFNAILDACCQLKDVQRLELVMGKMRELQVEPSAVTLGILVKTYGRAGHLDQVSAVWNEMLPQREQANSVTYGCMLDACVKCGNLKKALEVFDEVKKEGKHKNTVLYTTLIKGCSMQKNLQTALSLFREMKEEAVPCNTFTYNSILDVCINSGAITVAEGIFQQMISEEGSCGGASPDLITFSTLLKGYCQARLLEQAFMVVEAIRERGLPCDELVYNTLIDGCVKIGDLSMGLGFFEEMLRDGAKPSPITHSILGKLYRGAGYGQQSSEAVALLYQHHGLQPPVVSARRRGRHDKTRGTSPHAMLVNGRPSVSSQSSSESSVSHSLSFPAPMPFPSREMSSTNCANFSFSQDASTGLNNSLGAGCGPAPGHKGLPVGWESAVDPNSGKTYFYNHTLGKSQWDRPEDLSPPGPLPAGWECTVDPNSGKTYFYNHSLGKSQWDQPEDLSPPGPLPMEVSPSGPLPIEVQSMIQNLPEHMRSGPLLIAGPYPVPASQACASAPSEQASCQRAKSIIKI